MRDPASFATAATIHVFNLVDFVERYDVIKSFSCASRHDTFIHDTFIHDTFIHDTFIHDTFIHDTFIHDTFIHDTTQLEHVTYDRVVLHMNA